MKQSLIAVSMLSVLAAAPAAQAATYDVSARFTDGGIQGQTLFNGSFDWDGTTLTSFSGRLTQSMWAWNESFTQTNPVPPGSPQPLSPQTYINKKSGWSLAQLTATGGGQPPVLNLTWQLGGVTAPDSNGDVLASVFLVNSTDVYRGGGYQSNGPWAYGGKDGMMGAGTTIPGEVLNYNAFFTLAFNAANPTNTATAMGKIVYGDCTAYGLMGPMLTGSMCMTGLDSNGVDSGGVFGSMGGYPTNLTITAAVPEPETYAMFLAGLGLVGVIARRRKAA